LATKIHVIAITELEFWKLEFQAEVSTKNDNYLDKTRELIASGVRPIIQIGPSEQETRDLKGFPKASLIVQFHADETYLSKINYQVIKNPAVAMILRSYPIPKFNPLKLFRSECFGFMDLLDNFSIDNLLEFLKLFGAGLVMAKRQVFIATLERIYSKTSIPMPLGYNDLFAESFRKVNPVKEGLSLVDFALGMVPIKNKKFDIAFVGQSGKFTRRVAIKAMSKALSKEIILRKNYGGAIGIYGATVESGIENVNALTNSKLALCPPGNYSSNTFRIAESLICGAVPVFNQGSATDPISTYSYLCDSILELPIRWKKKVAFAVNLNQDLADIYVEKSLNNLSAEIERVKKAIILSQS
jgi:hypothetical protein